MAPCHCLRSPSHDAPVEKHAVDGLGNGVSKRKPWSGLGHKETGNTLAHRHPPVEPALYHRGSPRWSARGGTRDLVTQPPRLEWVSPQIAC